IYGTTAAKGDSTPERPHRVSRILEADNVNAVTSRDCLERLAENVSDLTGELARIVKARASAPKARTAFDLEEWIEAHADRIHVVRKGDWDRFGRKYVINPCPFNPAHTNEAAVLLKFQGGAIGFRCLHNGCSDNGWRELRALVGDLTPDTPGD